MAKSNLRLVTPATVNRTVAPKRSKNAALRTREHLSPAEVEKLIEATKITLLGGAAAACPLAARAQAERVRRIGTG
jgi:hypothetical protein